MDEGEVTKVIKGLEEVYGDIRVTQVKKHDYLRMDLYFITKGKVKVSIVNYLKGVIYSFP